MRRKELFQGLVYFCQEIELIRQCLAYWTINSSETKGKQRREERKEEKR